MGVSSRLDVRVSQTPRGMRPPVPSLRGHRRSRRGRQAGLAARATGGRARSVSTPLASRSRLAASRTLLSAASTISSPDGSFAPSSAEASPAMLSASSARRWPWPAAWRPGPWRECARSPSPDRSTHRRSDPRPASAGERLRPPRPAPWRCPGDERLVLDQGVEPLAHLVARPARADVEINSRQHAPLQRLAAEPVPKVQHLAMARGIVEELSRSARGLTQARGQ